MAAHDPAARKLAASIGGHSMWANTPNRTVRLANAHAASPVSFDHWLAWAKEKHPDAEPQWQIAAARSAHRLYMQQMALRSRNTRAKKKEAAAAAKTKSRRRRTPAA